MSETFKEVPEFQYSEPFILLPNPRGYVGYEEEDYTHVFNSYSDFDRIFDDERRTQIHDAIALAIKKLGFVPEDVLLAGYKGDALAEDVDRMKLEDPSVGAGLSTTNLIEQTKPTEETLDDAIRDIIEQMTELYNNDELDDDTRQEFLTQIKLLKVEKDNPTPIKELDMEEGWPVYYFTPPDAVLDGEPEDNPLAYSVDIDGRGQIGIYDWKMLTNNGHKVGHLSELSMRSDNQLLVVTTHQIVERALIGRFTFSVIPPAR